MLGLRFFVKAFSSCGERGPLFIVVRGPLTIAASLVAEHRLQTRRLSSCGSRAQLLHGMWDLPDQGSNPCPLHWQADSQPLRHQGSPKWPLFLTTITTTSQIGLLTRSCASTTSALSPVLCLLLVCISSRANLLFFHS